MAHIVTGRKIRGNCQGSQCQAARWTNRGPAAAGRSQALTHDGWTVSEVVGDTIRTKSADQTANWKYT